MMDRNDRDDMSTAMEEDEAPRRPAVPEPPRLVNLADEEDVDLESPEIKELLALYEETLGSVTEGQ
ncbi:MAG: hypothetical protein KC729_20615, partial [Candidatus Eisenbacteria bacterium]|nr:hypothetical protein [Candidatus Eisenbacteria bacterium]